MAGDSLNQKSGSSPNRVGELEGLLDLKTA
jgi:hypothetical protein